MNQRLNNVLGVMILCISMNVWAVKDKQLINAYVQTGPKSMNFVQVRVNKEKLTEEQWKPYVFKKIAHGFTCPKLTEDTYELFISAKENPRLICGFRGERGDYLGAGGLRNPIIPTDIERKVVYLIHKKQPWCNAHWQWVELGLLES